MRTPVAPSRLLFLSFLFVVASAPQAFAETNANPVKGAVEGPDLAYSLHARLSPPDSAADDWSEVFTFRVTNRGKSAYSPAPQASQVFDIKVQLEGSGDVPAWAWSKGRTFHAVTTPVTIPADDYWEIVERWPIGPDVVEGNYTAEAEFLPTHATQQTTFSISKPLDLTVLFTGKLIG
jgi:hypothetical protein